MNHPTLSAPYRISQRGLTLVEVMVAITISLILLAGVMQIFISSRQTYRVQDGQARMQENGRFAVQFLTNDIRMAGHTGCASRSAPIRNIVAGANIVAADFTNRGITGFDPTTNPLPAPITGINTLNNGDVVAGTDVLIIKSASPTGAVVALPTAPTVDAAVTVNAAAAPFNINIGDILFISDCNRTDIFTATAAVGAGTVTIGHDATANSTTSLSKIYGAGVDAEVMRMEISAYYIAADPSNNNVPTLYRRRLTNGSTMVAEPLAEGVENMQILYGEDTDATPDRSANRYVRAGELGLNMSNVVSVRVSLLLRSTEDNITTKKQSYTFNGAVVPESAVPDRRLRRVFTTTIHLRNR